MVGADPEFAIVDPATGYLTGATFQLTNAFGNIGADCSGGEIRPSPGSPRQVTENIRALIRASLDSHYKDKILLAGGGSDSPETSRGSNCKISTGGHIHFNVRWESNSYGEPNEDYRRHIALLDRYIGRPMKAMVGGRRGGGGGYGAEGSIDTKEYGFEYRTPPSWLTDPRLTEAVLSVGYLITEKFLNDPGFRLDGTTICTEDDLKLLIPTSGPFKKHWEEQVDNYGEYIFSSFNLAAEDMRERWSVPALIAWKRTDQMTDLMVGFRERVAAALAEKRRLEAEAQATREQRAREDAARLEAARVERERAQLQARQIQALTPAAPEANGLARDEQRRIYGRISNVSIPASTQKQYCLSYATKVFIHRETNGDPTLTQAQWRLNVGFLKVIELGGCYHGWSNHYITNARGRGIRVQPNIVYMSDDLKPLVKRARNLPFKIKFVKIKEYGHGGQLRTIWFTRSTDRDLDAILRLLSSACTKRQVPVGFYTPETIGLAP
jgi:hypothetical protein